MKRIECAIEANKLEIERQAKSLNKLSKEELIELAKNNNVYFDKSYRKSWIAYDLAIKLVTGYTVA